jgi:hypothetical protein
MSKALIIKIIVALAIAALAVLLWVSRSVTPLGPGNAPGGAGVVLASSVHSDCETKPQPSEKFDCYELVFKSYMEENGAKKTLVLLDELNKLGGYASSNCHPLSHKVGNIALHVYGSVPKAAPEYLPVCHSGYYHGLLEEYLGNAPSYEEGVREVCETPEKSGYFNWFQCTHGLGHGVMQYRENEVPQSVKDCDLVDPANQAREICYGGVFMENITSEEKTGHKSKYIKPEDPIYPCNAVEEQYKSACYFLSSSMILKLNTWDFEEGFKTCDTAEANYRWLCYQSMGRDVAGSTLRNIERSKALCLLGTSTEAKENCYFGAVRDFINEKGEFDSAISFCKALDDAYKQKCHEGIYLDLALYHQGESYLQICAKLDEPYESSCTSRSGL